MAVKFIVSFLTIILGVSLISHVEGEVGEESEGARGTEADAGDIDGPIYFSLDSANEENSPQHAVVGMNM